MQTLTVSAPPAQLTPTVASQRDPICDEWETTTRSYTSQQDPWTRSDPNVPGSHWNPQQRAAATATAPVIRDEAANLRELASRTKSPCLRVLLRAQAVYEDAFADRLPSYQPPCDAGLWQAALTFRASAAAVCTAIIPG